MNSIWKLAIVVLAVMLEVGAQLNASEGGGGAGAADSDENYVFDVADLALDYQDSLGFSAHLEAFRTRSNDQIIDRRETRDYPRLKWRSMGDPQLAVLTLDYNDASRKLVYTDIFRFEADKFSVAVSMLSELHRSKLRDEANKKYQIDVQLSQIVALVLDKFSCQLTFYSQGQRTVFNGKGVNLHRNPVTVVFDSDESDPRRQRFEAHLRAAGASFVESPGFQIQCKVTNRGKTKQENRLVITADQLNQLKVAESVFGPTGADWAYVTRDQMASLASDIYMSMNIFEECDLPELEFEKGLVDRILDRVASQAFQYVEIDQALRSLSKYNLEPDLRPDVIKEELGKVLVIKTTGDKKHIVATRTQNQSESQKSRSEKGGSGKIGFKAFSFGLDGKATNENENSRESASTSIDDQLSDINSHSDNQVQWEIRGERIVPKAIKVARLERAAFSKSITFQHVKRVSREATFERTFQLMLGHFGHYRLFHDVMQTLVEMKSFLGMCSKRTETTTTTTPNVDAYLQQSIESIKTSKRYLPRGTILLVGSQIVSQSFDASGKGFGEYEGWFICNGENGTPDFRQRTPAGFDASDAAYNELGKKGGHSSVVLTEAQMPSHNHYVHLATNTDGNHQHSYQDVFFSESNHFGNAISKIAVPGGLGLRGDHDWNNLGFQMDRQTEATGNHAHVVTGHTQPSGQSQPVDVGSPFYVVHYIIFIGL